MSVTFRCDRCAIEQTWTMAQIAGEVAPEVTFGWNHLVPDRDCRPHEFVCDGCMTREEKVSPADELLALLPDVDELRADYIRGAARRLPDAVVAGITELAVSGHVRDRVAYVLGMLRQELEERGL